MLDRMAIRGRDGLSLVNSLIDEAIAAKHAPTEKERKESSSRAEFYRHIIVKRLDHLTAIKIKRASHDEEEDGLW